MCFYKTIKLLLTYTKQCSNIIIVSEQSGVECACACVLRVVENFVVAYLELRATLRYVQRLRDEILESSLAWDLSHTPL